MEKKSKVLILGGTGIIGRELTAAISRRGYAVYVVSRSGSTQIKGVIPIQADVYRPQDLRAKLADLQFEAIVDLLSFQSQQLQSSIHALADICRQYIFLSSATIYQGVKDNQAIVETSPMIAEGWRYPLQKIETEKVLAEACRRAGIAYTIVRPYIVYSDQRISFGEWESRGDGMLDYIRLEKPIPLGRELAQTKTTLTHAADLAVGIAGLIANNRAYNQDFHITSEESVTWEEVLRIAARVMQRQLHLVDVSVAQVEAEFPDLVGKIDDRCLGRSFDNTKIKQAVPGFACQRSLEQGYRHAINKHQQLFNRDINYIQIGRIDRLSATHCQPSKLAAIRDHRSEIRHSSMRGYARHSIGYYPWLYHAYSVAKSTVKRQSVPDAYAVSIKQ